MGRVATPNISKIKATPNYDLHGINSLVSLLFITEVNHSES